MSAQAAQLSVPGPVAPVATPTPLELLDLPNEVLSTIMFWVVRLLELNDGGDDADGGLPTIEVSYDIDNDSSSHIDNDRFMPRFTDLRPSGIFDTNTLMPLLLTNRRLHDIGLRRFYRMYSFRCYQADSWRCLFMKKINETSLGCIRVLTLGLPYRLRTMPSKNLCRYVEMLKRLPCLRKLTLTTTSSGAPRTSTPNNGWIENNRALLHAGAWITLRSDKLKYGTWSEENTVIDNSFMGATVDGRLSVVLTSQRPCDLRDAESIDAINDRNAELEACKDRIRQRVRAEEDRLAHYDNQLEEYFAYPMFCELYDLSPYVPWEIVEDNSGIEIRQHVDDAVDYVSNLPKPVKPNVLLCTVAEKEILDQQPEQILPIQSMLLDSWKIRRMGWEDMAKDDNFRPTHYQLPADSANSEVNTPVLSAMSEDELAEEVFFHIKDWKEAGRKLSEGVCSLEICGVAAWKMQANASREEIMKGLPPRPRFF